MSASAFPVEAGHIMMFARAIGDPNPAYYGEADLVTGRHNVVAPPTFVEASLHYDPDFPYRPRVGIPWFGSAAAPSGAPPPKPAALAAAKGGTSMHAGTKLEYFGLLRPGDVLTVRELPPEAWEKRGSRGGRLWFTTSVQEFLRRDELVVRSTTSVVTTQTKVETTDAPPSPRRPRRPASSESLGRLSIGDARRETLVENLSRGQILLYAGASGDFSPQHTDEIWNTRVAGYPSVFAHGMLTMGMAGRILTDWFGVEALRSFEMRFSRQVWPGDDLTATAEVTRRERVAAERTEATVKVETANGNGQVVATGSARVEFAE